MENLARKEIWQELVVIQALGNDGLPVDNFKLVMALWIPPFLLKLPFCSVNYASVALLIPWISWSLDKRLGNHTSRSLLCRQTVFIHQYIFSISQLEHWLHHTLIECFLCPVSFSFKYPCLKYEVGKTDLLQRLYN